MAKKNSRENNLSKLNKELNDINNNIGNNIAEYSKDISTQDFKNDYEHERVEKEIDNIMYKELKNITDHTGDEISKFLIKLYNDFDFANDGITGLKSNTDLDSIFKQDSSSIMNFFQDRYRNKWYLYDDLRLVSEQLFELSEGINVTRDAIISADDFSEPIARKLSFQGMAKDAVEEGALETIKTMERQHKLHQKIKNHLIPNALKLGTYYSYTIPYSKIMETYAKKNKTNGKRVVKENYELEPLTESEIKDFINTSSFKDNKEVKTGDIANYMNDILKNIKVDNDPVCIARESVVDELGILMNRDKLNKIGDNTFKGKSNNNNFFVDGTSSVDGSNKDFKGDFDDTSGCYTKLISPRNLIPLRIMNQQTIGYYHLYEEKDSFNNTSQSNLRMSPSFTNAFNKNDNKTDLEKELVSKITDKIVKSFDKKFLEKNSEFKELIANALLFDEMYKKNVKFQFIEKEYITEFVINEDENGEGRSILADCLFYAKLYLALLLFKMITIITKSNDTRVYYVKTSNVDKDVMGKVQEVGRSIRNREINFSDLMNYNSMVTKIGAGKSIFVPVGKSGERAFDPEIISGQQVELHNELMEFLRSNMISSMGIPSVFLQHINEVDYSRTLVMLNNKFAQRVSSLQIDLSFSITELYKKLLKFTTDLPDTLIERFSYQFKPPTAQINTASSEQIRQTEDTAMFMVENEFGKDAELTDDDRIVKDLCYKELVRELEPSLPWDRLTSIRERASVEASRIKIDKERIGGNSDENSDGGGY